MSFKSEQAKIAKKEKIPMKNAGAILAASSRNASPAAKRKNPLLRKVKGEVNIILFGIIVLVGFIGLVIVTNLRAAPVQSLDTVKLHYMEAMTDCGTLKAQARTDCEKRVKDWAEPAFKYYNAKLPEPPAAKPANRTSKEKK